MQILIFLIMNIIVPPSTSLQIDFGKEKDGQDWRIVDDGVMGGLSKGYLDFTENTVTFKGSVSLENNGGFTSFRSPYQSFDLSAYEKIIIRLKAEGQQLAFTMSTDRRWYLPYFKKQIEVKNNEWEVIELPLNEFKAYRVGQNLGYPLDKENAAKVIRMGFITDSKKASSFEATIDYVRFE